MGKVWAKEKLLNFFITFSFRFTNLTHLNFDQSIILSLLNVYNINI